MTGCMSTTPTAAMETLLGLPSLQLVVEKDARQPYRLYCFNQFKKSDWGHSVNFKMATEDFPVLLAPSDCMLPLEEFDRKYLVEYLLKLKHGFLPMALNSILMAPCLRVGRVLEFFRKNLIPRHLSLLEHSPLSFRLRFTPLWLVPTTVWGSVWVVKRSAFARTVELLYWR
jgi:hypothetical protein